MATNLTVWAGRAYPLGATWTGEGVNFALFSEHATGVDLCLFDSAESPQESARIPLPTKTHGVWHGFFPDLKPGQIYGYRVDGPYAPMEGHRFNAKKLLLDPYAKAVAGPLKWDDALFGYKLDPKNPDADLVPDERDSAPFMFKAVVLDNAFDWEGTGQLHRPRNETIFYETHVRGFSRQWSAIPEQDRGTYRAIGSEAAIAYFKKLGVTAVELLPIHQFVLDRALIEKGLTNYWGYNSIGFFAPHAAYSASGDTGGQVHEFKTMVKRLHQAGIEVILDVVYNHTAEGNHLGPTLSFRGIDNAAYYRLKADDPRLCVDFTGCGNTPNVPHRYVLQMIMDSLRYWVTEMHVDGFRFDLAPALAREYDGVNPHTAFLNAIHQDPILSRVKMIAEPWDIGEGGYQVGNFPPLWAEWNGKYRDCVRRWWKGDEGTLSEFTHRLVGSPDLYQWNDRTPTASVNFITAHDGFTLRDLVSYNEKHNEANGEESRDGESNNNSWNCGAEGPSDDPAIETLRRRQQRNFLTTLFLSQGMPMLVAGDEYGRTQEGNNNAYCQDSPLSWLAWERKKEEEDLFAYTSKLIEFRQHHPAFHRPKFFVGRKPEDVPDEVLDLVWFDGAGQEMGGDTWNTARGFAMMLCDESANVHDEKGNPIRDHTFLFYLHAHFEAGDYILPGAPNVKWELVLNTAEEAGFVTGVPPIASGSALKLESRSIALLRQVAGTDAEARHGAPIAVVEKKEEPKKKK